MTEKNKRKRIHDIILGLSLLLIAAMLFVTDIISTSSADNDNKMVTVSVDEKLTAEYPLKKDGTYGLHGSHL